MSAAPQLANDSTQPRSRPTARNKLALIDAAWVCHHLAELRDLTQADKAILCGLIRHIDQASLDADRTTVFPSTICLALDTGYTPRQVVRSLARLEARALIRRFTVPRWRTAHTDLAGFCAIASDALDAHAAEKERQLQAFRRGPIATLVEEDSVSSLQDTESSLTETDKDPAIYVHANDASRGRVRRRPDKPAAANGTIPQPGQDRDNGKAQICSPGGAGFSAGPESEPSIPAEPLRRALVAAWDASPTLRRLVDLDQLRTAPVDELTAAVEREYLTTVTGIRNPNHIWAWAINRHGPVNAVLGWLIACDTPATADRSRNAGGWFTRFATAERAWDLSRNLRQLARAAAVPAAPAVPPPAGEPSASAAMPAAPAPESVAVAVEDEDGARMLAQYRAAWVQRARQGLGRERGEAVWNSWLGEARLIAIDDGRLTIRVKTKVAASQLFDRYDQICQAAAAAIGFEGADFVTGLARQ